MFTVAGVSTYKDGTKVRFANDLTRVKILIKNGHENIELIQLPNPMEKTDVVKYLLTSELMSIDSARCAIEEADEKYNGAKTVPVTKTKKTKAKVTTPAATEDPVDA